MNKPYEEMTDKEVFDSIVKDFRENKQIMIEDVELIIFYAQDLENDLEVAEGKKEMAEKEKQWLYGKLNQISHIIEQGRKETLEGTE